MWKVRVRFECALCDAIEEIWTEILVGHTVRSAPAGPQVGCVGVVTEDLPEGWERYWDPTCQTHLIRCGEHL